MAFHVYIVRHDGRAVPAYQPTGQVAAFREEMEAEAFADVWIRGVLDYVGARVVDESWTEKLAILRANVSRGVPIAVGVRAS